MNSRERLQEQYEDTMLALMMEQYLWEQGEQAWNENERLRKTKEVAVPPQTDKKIRRLILHPFRHKKKTRVMRNLGIAACFTVCVTATAFAAFPELKINAMNLLLTITDEHADFQVSEDKGQAYQNAEPEDTIYDFTVNWIPDGFSLKSTESIPNCLLEYEYTSQDGKSVTISKMDVEGGTLSVDTEDANTKYVNINGNNALFIDKMVEDGYGKKYNQKSLTWWNGDTTIMSIVSEGLEESEIIHIAKEIQ